MRMYRRAVGRKPMKVIRVFPRKTTFTPDDDDVRFDTPGLFDEADKVYVSVTWTWDKERGEELADAWRCVCNDVSIGGAAYDDPGGEFTPGMFVKHGAVFTSRGCPNSCWFCVVPKREGAIREIKIHDGYNILDSNLLACSDEHIKKVFAMLDRQPQQPKFTGGLEAARLKPWMCEEIVRQKPSSAFFAYDTPDDYEPLVEASKMLQRAGYNPKTRTMQAYVLIGYRNDTFEKAEARLMSVANLGIMPMAMLFDRREGEADVKKWRQYQRTWSNKFIVGSKMQRMASQTA